MQSVAKFLLPFFFLLLSSCIFGPVKELKSQIEDSWTDEDIPKNPTRLAENVPEASSKQLWQQNIGGEFLRNLEPAYCDGVIYVSNNEKSVYAIDATNGEILWSRALDDKVSAGIICNENRLYFVTGNGFLWALSIDGITQWKSFVGQILTKPLHHGDSVLVKTINNKFSSYNASNGSLNWSYQSPSPPLLVKSWGGMVYSEETIYSGLPSGKIVALNFNTGALMWETTYSQPKGTSDIARANDTTSSPVIDEPFIYIASSKGNVASLDKKTGNIIWDRPLSSFYGISGFQNYIIITHDSGSIYAVSKDTSEILWRNADFLNRDVKLGKFFQDKIMLGDYAGYLHFVDIETGKTSSRLKVAEKSIFNYISIEEDILVIDKSSNLTRIKITNSSPASSSSNLNNETNSELEKDTKIEQESASQNEKSFIDDLIFWD